jgi:hypothetical protein
MLISNLRDPSLTMYYEVSEIVLKYSNTNIKYHRTSISKVISLLKWLVEKKCIDALMYNLTIEMEPFILSGGSTQTKHVVDMGTNIKRSLYQCGCSNEVSPLYVSESSYSLVITRDNILILTLYFFCFKNFTI